jgi:hypothetical protein
MPEVMGSIASTAKKKKKDFYIIDKLIGEYYSRVALVSSSLVFLTPHMLREISCFHFQCVACLHTFSTYFYSNTKFLIVDSQCILYIGQATISYSLIYT